MGTRTLLRATAAAALLVGFISQANAIPTLRLTSSTGATVTVADGSAGDMSGLDGLVIFQGPLGDWDINVTTGVSKPRAGSPDRPMLDLNSINMTSTGASGSITIELSDTGFTSQPGGAGVGTMIGGTSTGSVDFKSFFDATNLVFGQGTELTSATFGSGAFSGSGSSSLQTLDPYSLTLLVTITHDVGQWPITSFDATVQVPEPASLLLVGGGLLAMGCFKRRRILATVAG